MNDVSVTTVAQQSDGNGMILSGQEEINKTAAQKQISWKIWKQSSQFTAVFL